MQHLCDMRTLELHAKHIFTCCAEINGSKTNQVILDRGRRPRSFIFGVCTCNLVNGDLEKYSVYYLTFRNGGQHDIDGKNLSACWSLEMRNASSNEP
jgi:hypothetical protein